MKILRATAVQLSPVLYSREGTIEKVVRTFTNALHNPRQALSKAGWIYSPWLPAHRIQP